MRTGQFKACFPVVKVNLTPPGFFVTTVAACFREKFLTDEILVKIFMAVCAPLSYLPEIPRSVRFHGIPFVACKTGCGEMRPLELEDTFIMLFKGKGKLRESIDGMTL